MKKSCGLIPLGDRVVILPEQAEQKGPLWRPESRWGQPHDRGKVVATGLGEWDEDGERQPLSVAVGDRVLFTKVRGMQVTIGDKVLLLLREIDLLAVIP